MSWSATGISGAQTFSRSYTYDQLDRLATMSSTGSCTGLSWTYDTWGNRTAQTPTGGTCNQSSLTVDTNNRITNPGFSYDASGNLLYDGSHHYYYDAENHLVLSRFL